MRSPPIRKPGRKKRALLLLIVLAGLTLSAYAYLTWDAEPRFWRRYGELEKVERQWQRESSDSYLRDVRLRSTSGLEVELTLRWPSESGPDQLPLIVILGGSRTGRRAAELVPDAGPVVLAALDYPYGGSNKLRGISIAAALPRIRGALLDTPPALWLALDYLLQLPFIDPTRVELVGVSLGAPLVTVAGALDPRFRRVWAIHGGGRPDRMIDVSLAGEVPDFLRPPLASFGGLLVAPLAPEGFAARIAPRPLILVNATDDLRIPRDCVVALYEAARAPKEQIWLAGGHVRPDATEQLRELVDLVSSRLGDELPASSVGSRN